MKEVIVGRWTYFLREEGDPPELAMRFSSSEPPTVIEISRPEVYSLVESGRRLVPVTDPVLIDIVKKKARQLPWSLSGQIGESAQRVLVADIVALLENERQPVGPAAEEKPIATEENSAAGPPKWRIALNQWLDRQDMEKVRTAEGAFWRVPQTRKDVFNELGGQLGLGIKFISFDRMTRPSSFKYKDLPLHWTSD